MLTKKNLFLTFRFWVNSKIFVVWQQPGRGVLGRYDCHFPIYQAQGLAVRGRQGRAVDSRPSHKRRRAAVSRQPLRGDVASQAPLRAAQEDARGIFLAIL